MCWKFCYNYIYTSLETNVAVLINEVRMAYNNRKCFLPLSIITGSGSNTSFLAVVVGVPVSIGMITLLLLAICVVAGVLYFRMRKRREIRFRRMAFDVMQDEDLD